MSKGGCIQLQMFSDSDNPGQFLNVRFGPTYTYSYNLYFVILQIKMSLYLLSTTSNTWKGTVYEHFLFILFT